MTIEEKKRLGERMNELNAEQLMSAVEILKPNADMENVDSDTIDIDFGAVDDSTLRKLKKYVDSCLV